MKLHQIHRGSFLRWRVDAEGTCRNAICFYGDELWERREASPTQRKQKCYSAQSEIGNLYKEANKETGTLGKNWDVSRRNL